jgi:nicotinate-nucleotide adenylyltransferase
VFGGTFDPPHVGHVVLPELVRRAVGADLVVYVPAAVSPHKADRPPTPPEDRLAMLELALADSPDAVIWTDELERAAAGEAVSYTVDTLERLRAMVGPDVAMRLLIGSDQAVAFDRWREPGRIVALAEPVVMLRPPVDTVAKLREAVSGGPAGEGDEWASRVVELPVMDVSATGVRAGEVGWEDRVPAGVAGYVRERGLYGVAGD